MNEATAIPTVEPILADLETLCAGAMPAVEDIAMSARRALRERVTVDGKVSGAVMDREQHAAHALSWIATYAESLRQMQAWSVRLAEQGKFGEIEKLLLQISFGEYLAQLTGGIMMSQNEFARLADLGLAAEGLAMAADPSVAALIAGGNTDAARHRLVEIMRERAGASTYGDCGLDEDFEMIRDQFRRFADEKVVPYAHEWHLKDEFIPMPLVQEMGEMGVFGLTVPEEYGGSGLGKTAMCVVSEELSRGYIGVGSLGTRSEIAAELILNGGTQAQKDKWLPAIASAEILPTAVFTEPNTGSDLGSLRTRAVKEGDDWKITGNKTWITHAARADVMTLLARTDPDTDNYSGLSMFLAEKPRGDDANPFPAEGMTGGEIEVLGYRGMKEYELGFDGFVVKGENLLGGVEGQGFKQLMKTFEGARIQTAARAVGVAQCAMEIALKYAEDRKQFGKSIVHFPRVYDKLAMMAVEIMVARQLSYHSAREKDEGRRCDLEAGMAKLLGARVAWACADNGVQIHGGNGFALEYPISRVLCDARILNIFEGAAEIQAQVIARRLLDGVN
ncbi:acyl-CoA dehydrogenase family protein [Albimonas sp. CAU 1670]|uniref:acyl-CoA dehydrogenase family protein n=1 Tax=Albimonas sp. CAU 1670 TaxID=3032599 RepID=UPI0023D9A71B|nr:acyl-CoA dehydrogenase family protein [Albimonas sp. CAU 1670]MDF2234648.1 acyl-CoA dehydrogenase family protein [Albimonas sp. CAU 1670]